MDIDKRLVDIARRDLLKMAAMTGTAGILTALGGTISPTLAAVAKLQPNYGLVVEPQSDPNSIDLGIVNVAIQLEQKAINTYAGMEKQKLVTSKDILEVARQFAADHTAHRDALVKAASDEFKGTPANVQDVGTFPVPETVLKGKEVDAVRYALALELIASKIYYDAFKDKLRTKAGRSLIITILPVETQHVGVFRSVLKFKLKDTKLPDNNRLVPFSMLEEQPTPEIPEGKTLNL